MITLYRRAVPDAEAVADRISTRFDNPWDYGEYSIQLNATVILADIPTQIKSTSELAYMIDSPAPNSEGRRVLKGDDLQFIMRRHAVEEALSRSFAENSFEVYFQPTSTSIGGCMVQKL